MLFIEYTIISECVIELFLPECPGKENQYGEEFQTTDEHQNGKYPFPEVRDIVESSFRSKSNIGHA